MSAPTTPSTTYPASFGTILSTELRDYSEQFASAQVGDVFTTIDVNSRRRDVRSLQVVTTYTVTAVEPAQDGETLVVTDRTATTYSYREHEYASDTHPDHTYVHRDDNGRAWVRGPRPWQEPERRELGARHASKRFLPGTLLRRHEGALTLAVLD